MAWWQVCLAGVINGCDRSSQRGAVQFFIMEKRPNLNPAVDRLFFSLALLSIKAFCITWPFTFLVSSLRGGLNSFCGTWRRCNSLEWNGHSKELRLALYPKNCTLHPVQLPDLG